MTDGGPDVVLGVINRFHAWRAPRRPGITILGSHLGRLVLTSVGAGPERSANGRRAAMPAGRLGSLC